MRFKVLQHRSARLSRHAAMLLVAGISAGCSSSVTRFTDGFFASAVPEASQPAPVDQRYTASVTQTTPVRAGNVQRDSLPPVSSAPVVASAGQMAAEPVNAATNHVQQRASDLQQSAVNGVNQAAETVNRGGEKVLGQLPAAATTAQKAVAGGGYTVTSGDSLYSIAQKHNVDVEALKKANGLSSGGIRIGQSLVIPAAVASATQVAVAPTQPAKVEAAVVPAETANDQKPSVKPYTPPQSSEKVIEEAQQEASIAPSATGISQLRWPVRGRILSSFGQREGGVVNDGIDIMVPEGTPVKAAENGVVIYAGDGLKEFGNTVLIRHENGLVTVYGHNASIEVQRGQKVRRGQEIARSGMSGNAKSPKLHFEVRKDSSPVNPDKYLES